MRLALPQPVLVPRPAPVTSGLDQRVLALVVGLAVAASAGLIATSHEIVTTLSDEPLRVATLLALTLALQLFSVQVYGRGSVSVSAIGILATAFVFDTGRRWRSRLPPRSCSGYGGDRSSTRRSSTRPT